MREFELRGKRVLVTGGGGFLGSHIVDRLRTLGCEHISAPRRSEFDLTRGEHVRWLFESSRPEVVIHAAAVVGGIGANRDHPGRFFYENALMGLQVIEACRTFRVAKTVVLGTVCSYPKQTAVPFREDDLWNGYPEGSNAAYGIAKKALLVQCQAYREEYGMNAIFLMPSNLYGPRDNFDLRTCHVIPALIRRFVEAQLQRAAAVELWGSGQPTRDFLHVTDAAEGILMAAEGYTGAQPVNLGSGQEVSIRVLAYKIAALVGFEGAVKWDTTQPDGQERRRLDVSRAEREFGFRARTQLDDGLRSTFEWYTRMRAQAELGNDASSVERARV